MKAGKKTQKNLDRRTKDYADMMSKPQAPEPGSFHMPGSRKKIY